MKKIIIFSLFFGLVIFYSQQEIKFELEDNNSIYFITHSNSGIQRIDLANILQFMKNESNVVIDIRNSEYFALSHIASSINIPISDIKYLNKETIIKLQRASNIVIYDVGDRAESAIAMAKELQKHHINNIKFYEGGWVEWKACRLPVEKIE